MTMPFVDDCVDTDGTALESHTPSGGTAYTAYGTADSLRINTNSIGSYSGHTGYCVVDSQGSADNRIVSQSASFGTTRIKMHMATRIVDVNNAVIHYLAGTGSAGRRLAELISGVIYDRITSQGASGEYVAVEVEGTTARLYADATDATTLIDTYTGLSGSTSEVSQGFMNLGNSGYIPSFTNVTASALVAAAGRPIP